MLGGASALLVALVALVWLRQVDVVWCIFAGIGAGMLAAALIGVALPNLLHRLQLDPQVAAGPVALTAADVVTLLIYFNVARYLLG
jgi:magnesium transporter